MQDTFSVRRISNGFVVTLNLVEAYCADAPAVGQHVTRMLCWRKSSPIYYVVGGGGGVSGQGSGGSYGGGAGAA